MKIYFLDLLHLLFQRQYFLRWYIIYATWYVIYTNSFQRSTILKCLKNILKYLLVNISKIIAHKVTDTNVQKYLEYLYIA